MTDIDDIKALAKRAASALDLDNDGAKKRKVQKKEDGRIGKSIWKEFSKETGIELGERTIKMTVKTKDVEAAIQTALAKDTNGALLAKIKNFFGWDKEEKKNSNPPAQQPVVSHEVAGAKTRDFGDGITYDYEKRQYTFKTYTEKIGELKDNNYLREKTITYNEQENPTSGNLKLKEISGGSKEKNPCFGSYSMYKFDVTVHTGENIGNLPELKNYKEQYYYNANTQNRIYKLSGALSFDAAAAELKEKGININADQLKAANAGISNGDKLLYNDCIVPKEYFEQQ